MATLPTLPTEYHWPAMPTDFSGWNTYSPTTGSELRSLLYGDNVVGVGQIDRSSQNCVIYLEPAQGNIDRYLIAATSTGYPFFVNGNATAITTGQDTYWLFIMPKVSAYANFLAAFPEGIRIDEERFTHDGTNIDATYGALMPCLSNSTSNGDTLRVGLGVKRVRLIGLHLSHDDASSTSTCVGLSTGVNGVSDYATTAADLSKEIILDRCVVRPSRSAPTANTYTRGIAANGQQVAIVDSAITEWRAGQDANAIHIFNGPSQIATENCLLVATGENWFTMGLTGLPMGKPYMPADLIVRGCHLRKLPTWNVNDDRYISGTSVYTNKNLLETKAADRLLIEGNVFDYSFADAQAETVVLKCVNQPGTHTAYYMHPTNNTQIANDTVPFSDADIGNKIRVTAGGTAGWYTITAFSTPYATLDSSPATAGTTGITAIRGYTPWLYLRDLTMRYNHVSRCPGVFTFQYADISGYPSRSARRWHIHDNLLVGMQHDQYNLTPQRYSFAIIGTGLQATYDDPDEIAMSDFTLEHNALLHVGIAKFTNYSQPIGKAAVLQSVDIPGAGNPQYGDQYVNRDNIMDTCYYGGAMRNSTSYGTASCTASYQNYVWGPNVQIGTQANSPSYWASPASQPSSYFADTYNDVGFADWQSMDFRLTSAGTNGDYRAGQSEQSSDGKDMGPDYSMITSRKRAAQDGRRSVKRRLRIRI